jgi:hypothetical protein
MARLLLHCSRDVAMQKVLGFGCGAILTPPSPISPKVGGMDGSLSHAFQTSAAIGMAGTSGAPADRRVAEIAAQARIGIDAVTGLATDFLNQFNEVAMLLDMIASDPSMIEDLEDWRARDYVAHFAASGFADRHLALEAYELSPPLTRRRFDMLCSELADILAQGLAFLQNCRAAGAEAAVMPAAQALGVEVRQHLDRLDTLIHAGLRRPAQAHVDAMFARRVA